MVYRFYRIQIKVYNFSDFVFTFLAMQINMNTYLETCLKL